MAKELPYFQFEPAEYLTGDISFCSLSAQGLFTILCSYYWQRSCKLTKDQFLRRINSPKEFQELVDENVIKLEKNSIKIKFLDIQLERVENQSKVNKINGSKGGRPRKKNPKETETKPKQNPKETETKGIREDKIREDKIKLDEDVLYNVDDLKNNYLNSKVFEAVLNNKNLKLKNKEDLEKRLERFTEDLKQKGRFSEKWNEYTSYFLNCLKKDMFKNVEKKDRHDKIIF